MTMEEKNNSFMEIRELFVATHQARETALKSCREVIQLSSKSIRALHREEIGKARLLIDEARERVRMTSESLQGNPEVLYAGYIHDAQKEYVEAEVMYSIITQTDLPIFKQLEVHPSAYLNGIAEAASETRRYVLDLLKADNYAMADPSLKIMDYIYDELITFDFPDAITGGLRRTTDALRAVLERTRADLTLTTAQRRLEIALDSSDFRANHPGEQII